jgi:hypothetical protein
MWRVTSVSTCKRTHSSERTLLRGDSGGVLKACRNETSLLRLYLFATSVSTSPGSTHKEVTRLQVDTDITRYMSLLPILLHYTSFLECVLLQVDTDITRYLSLLPILLHYTSSWSSNLFTSLLLYFFTTSVSTSPGSTQNEEIVRKRLPTHSPKWFTTYPSLLHVFTRMCSHIQVLYIDFMPTHSQTRVYI